MTRRWRFWFGLIVALYLGIGLVFHWQWTRALRACDELRRARGEWVDPGFSPWLELFFDATYWPVYAWVNWQYSGTLFATPCDRMTTTPTPVQARVPGLGFAAQPASGPCRALPLAAKPVWP
ncbi:MAG: hypothetical protein GXO36_01620 [Chloroflexi bacterium]|nr:hypothetical protein [Chloroflexota bacterium]